MFVVGLVAERVEVSAFSASSVVLFQKCSFRFCFVVFVVVSWVLRYF